MFTFASKFVSVSQFVEFWAPQYSNDLDTSYSPIINQQPLTLENLRTLFAWKSGKQFESIALKLVNEKYGPCLAEINTLPENLDGRTFVEKYGQTGAIWSIFLLHCWQPEKYPIYDQNVHRAMRFVTSKSCQEHSKASDQLNAYFDDYLPFYQQFKPSGTRNADRALFMCGKFLKTCKFPDIVEWRRAGQKKEE